MKKTLLLLSLFLGCLILRAGDTLTMRQVYNYNVGDTFIYKIRNFNECVNYMSVSYDTRIVTQKAFSADLDTIYYQYNSSLLDTITHLNSFAIYQSTSISAPSCSPPSYDTVSYFGYRSDRTRIGCFESSYTMIYTASLGMSYYDMAGGGDPCGNNGSRTELIHFGNDSVHYDLIDGVVSLKKRFNINLSPNPVIDKVQLSIDDVSLDGSQLILTDLMGRPVYTSSVSTKNNVYDIATLPSGLYLWHVESDHQLITSGKIIKQ